jgi:hypothetical protein
MKTVGDISISIHGGKPGFAPYQVGVADSFPKTTNVIGVHPLCKLFHPSAFYT